MARQKRKKQAKRRLLAKSKPKPMPRRSFGGRAPFARLPREDKVSHFKDHNGASYTVVCGSPYTYQEPSIIPKLGIHLYCLDTPEPSPHALGSELCSQKLPDHKFDYRVDIYTSFDSIEQCIDHHRREKEFRRQATADLRKAAVEGMNDEDAYEFLTTQFRGKEPLPHIVPTWCDGVRFWREYYDNPDRYKSWILVMKKGCKTWTDVLEQGLLLVQFDLDWHVTMETLFCDEDPAGDSLLPGDKQPWLVYEKVERPPLITTTLLCLRKEPAWTWTDFFRADGSYDYDKHTEFFEGWKTPGSQRRLVNQWEAFSRVIWGCYGDPNCDGCLDGEPHDRCEWDLDEHYFDDEGQCIAFRRVTEYRRRSKRLANNTSES